MSTGALFNLIANDGKADRMILATELIQKRICDIRCYKAKRNFQNIEPTLSELEKTHILFMSAHYKPFIATAFEYGREPLFTGTGQWGEEENKFSIPQTGDFFHDMILHLKTEKLKGAIGQVPAYSNSMFPDDIEISEGDVLVVDTSVSNDNVKVYTNPGGASDTVIRITKQFVDYKGEEKNPGENIQGFVRWVEFPGIKAFKKVSFEVSGTTLDTYGHDAMLFNYQYLIPLHKENGYKKLVGQDLGLKSISTTNTSVAGASPFGIEASGAENGVGTALASSFAESEISTMEESKFYDGYQTPAQTKPGLDVWTPLLFWFNKLLSLAIPSVAIPFGQRYIKIQVEDFRKMAKGAPGALKLQTKYERFQTEDGNLAGAANASVLESDYIVNYTEEDAQLIFSSQDETALGVDSTSGRVKNIQLFINNLYVLPEVHDIFIQRIGFNLIRVHKLQVSEISTPNSTGDSTGIELNGLKFPIETMYFGFQPTENSEAGSEDYWKSWHLYGKLTKHNVVSTAKVPGVITNAEGVITHKSLATVQTGKKTFWKETPTVNKIGLISHNIDIYKLTDELFWNAYEPFKFGTMTIKTPDTVGTYMMTFTLYPGEYQPAGHLNLSRAKQTYLKYESSYINSDNKVRLQLVAIAINFLVIADGSAVLRYTT